MTRCLCGLAIRHHFTGPGLSGRKLTCEEARAKHRRASRSCAPLVGLLRKAV